MNNFDQDTAPKEKKRLVTMRLLVISITIYVLALMTAVLGIDLGFSSSNKSMIVTVMVIAALSMNIIGVVKGFLERKQDFDSAVNGIVGIIMYYVSSFGDMIK